MMSTKQNFCLFFRAFFYFDCMISGSEPNEKYNKETKDMQNIDRSILEHLISYSLDDTTKERYCQYIYKAWSMFCAHKYTLVLNLTYLDEHFADLNDLIMFSVSNDHSCKLESDSDSEIDEKDDNLLQTKSMEESNRNLFKPMIFKLFPNVKEIVIYTTSVKSGTFVYSFSLQSFNKLYLNAQGHKPRTKITIKATMYWNTAMGMRTWLWKAYKQNLKNKWIDRRRWKVNLNQVRNAAKKVEDCLTINGYLTESKSRKRKYRTAGYK